MKIVFFGTPKFAVKSLESLYNSNDIEVLAVVTQKDKAVGRKKVITPPEVKECALRLGLPILQPKNKKELEEMLTKIKADLFVVIAFGMILSEKILNMPKYGAINIHTSLLPKYRGASPIQESLLNGDKETGISIIKMDAELDHGDIYLIRRVKIEEGDTLESLSGKLSSLTSEILPLAIKDIRDGVLAPIPQDHKNATFCTKISKNDGKINPETQAAEEIYNKIRAYTPWPSVYTTFNGKTLKILEAKIEEGTLPVGKFKLDGEKVKIGTKKGVLVPLKVQLEGKSPMDIKSFINGYKNLLTN